MRFLDLMRPVGGVLPEIKAPDRKVPFVERCMWTAMALFIFLICCQVPLYGVETQGGSDPLYWMRVILASNKGSLMELGTSPIINSSMVMTILAGAKIISVDMSLADDKQLFATAMKLFGFLITFGEAIAYVLSGAYGAVGFIHGSFIVLQLCGSGMLVMMLDELVQKGYGLGGGISLFMTCNICESIFWRIFSPTTISTGKGTEFEGAFVSFVHLMVTRPNKLEALRESFYRDSGPNMTSLFGTVIIFLVVLYLQGFRIELKVVHQKMRGQEGSLPLKLFYTSNIPIILQTTMAAQINFASQMLHRRFRDNPIVNLIGQWQDMDVGGRYALPVGGIAYYISPPRSLMDVMDDPIRCFVYVFWVLVSCALFSKAWLDVSATSSKDLAKQLRDGQMVFKDHQRSSLISVLDKYVPTVALLGGIAIGALTLLADFLGAIGSGTGILLAVSILYGYYETLEKEWANNKQLL